MIIGPPFQWISFETVIKPTRLTQINLCFTVQRGRDGICYIKSVIISNLQCNKAYWHSYCTLLLPELFHLGGKYVREKSCPAS